MGMEKTVSRQREWQVHQRAIGNCMVCGKPRNGVYRSYCTGCAEKIRARYRKKRGFRPWREGEPGRPPLDQSA